MDHQAAATQLDWSQTHHRRCQSPNQSERRRPRSECRRHITPHLTLDTRTPDRSLCASHLGEYSWPPPFLSPYRNVYPSIARSCQGQKDPGSDVVRAAAQHQLQHSRGPGPPPAWRKRLIVAAKKRLVRLLLARLLAALAARILLLRLVSAAAAAVTTLGAARTLAEPARGSG